MTGYEALDEFTDTLIYDLTDLVKGGNTGDANIPLKALADRTQYLFNRQGVIKPKIITSSYTYDPADVNTLFAFHINANTTFNLPNVTNLVTGSTIRICTRIPIIKALTINCNSSQKIYDGSTDLSAMYMHDGERLWLIAASSTNGATADHWEILVADGNFFTAGDSFGGRKVVRNTIVNDGTVYNRADMPRLWAYASLLGAGIVSDLVWLSNPGGQPVYRSCYSAGNGGTTFRVPDERAMHDRYLDMGRGIDNSRLYNAPGGYARDALLKHTHRLLEGGDRQLDSVGTHRVPQSNSDHFGMLEDFKLEAVGGAENLVKTIGKIPLTRY